jgi:hypothetical protein
MPKKLDELGWREAVIKVLQGNGSAMHYTDIAEAITAQKLRKTPSANPANCVSTAINNNIRDFGENSLFVRVSAGEYILRTHLASAQQPSPDSANAPVSEPQAQDLPGVVAAFGMFWRREFVHWVGATHVLGAQSRGAATVNFADQRGVYILYDGRAAVYVGRAIDQPLGTRLQQHTFDRLNGRWDRFSWFGLRAVRDDGSLEPLVYERPVSAQALVATMEALIIEALEPPQNRRRGDDFRAVEFIQIESPEIEKQRKTRLLEELRSKALS